ncbi:OFA family MFS transporter [Desulforhopalus singaporensis]|uniref:Nitrate/nitrite transporter NarK n=1 Tax=Desulforhopalus singaporensis TaxID=91360 RepID=A0A1H0VNT6_9BACT|nr:OFA family MFS transporter [Desulforhopalus singaporensis]SDP80100.1 Nitrate/nitrite transporter NarK [Desulforhopalus singaporensis]
MNSTTHLTITISRGWLTTFATSTIGVALGILYVWSVIKSGIPDAWGWSNADKALPYSIMTIAFSFTMVPAGRLQDIIGPRRVILLGGFLTGLGCIISGLGGDSKLAYVVGFGLVTGIGVGCGYCALAPSAMRWFPPQKTGFIVGIVVAGIGLSPVFLAPLSAWSLNFFQFVNDVGVVEKGISNTIISLGFGIWAVVALCVGLIQIPPVGYTPGLYSMASTARHTSDTSMTWRQMVSTSQFWLMFFMFFAGSATGLIFISVATDLGKNALGSWAFLAVIVLSLGNSGGRILAGILSDKIGRQLTMFCEFACQGLVVCLLFWLSKHGGGSWFVVLFVVFMIGLNYGSNHALFPATCKDFYGLEHFGVNFGLLFCAFGTAGLVMPWLNGFLQDVTGKPDTSYILIIAMMAVASVLALVSRKLGPPELNKS